MRDETLKVNCRPPCVPPFQGKKKKSYRCFISHPSSLIPLVFSLIPLVSSLAFCAWNPEQEKVVRDYGEKAMNYYYSGDFSQAIYMWQEILKIDPSQTQPDKLIKQARAKLQEKLKPVTAKFYSQISKGEYTDAQTSISQILTLDPANPDMRGLSSRLDDIVKIVPEIPTKGRVPEMMRLAVTKYLKTYPDVKMAFNALRQAQSIEPSNNAVSSLLELFEDNYPAEAKMTFPNMGANVVDHKLAIALSYFYQGRFDLTVQECKEVLELEPNNKVALSRTGSGYYALGQKSKAREYWQKALNLEPQNRKLQKMLANLGQGKGK